MNISRDWLVSKGAPTALLTWWQRYGSLDIGTTLSRVHMVPEHAVWLVRALSADGIIDADAEGIMRRVDEGERTEGISCKDGWEAELEIVIRSILDMIRGSLGQGAGMVVKYYESEDKEEGT